MILKWNTLYLVWTNKHLFKVWTVYWLTICSELALFHVYNNSERYTEKNCNNNVSISQLFDSYVAIVPGLKSQWKFADDFLTNCAVSHLYWHHLQPDLMGFVHVFLGQQFRGSKMGLKWMNEFWILLSFPQFLSVGAVIQHEVA